METKFLRTVKGFTVCGLDEVENEGVWVSADSFKILTHMKMNEVFGQ